MSMNHARAMARALIERHGLRAQAVAAEHVSEMSGAGDNEGATHWREIGLAVQELRATSSRP